MELQKDFNEYFGINEYENFQETNISIPIDNRNIYIQNSIFSFITTGSAIRLNSSKVLIETCTFHNNSSVENGGSIRIMQSESVLVHVCILFSTSSRNGCAYYIESSETNKNYALECSVLQCRGDFTSLYHQYGDIQINNMNTSYHHEIQRYAGYYLYDPTGRGIINFTTASNSSSNVYYVFLNDNCTITYCNYINNEYKANTYGMIYCSGTNIFSNCSFIGNSFPHLFSQKPTVVNCYFYSNYIFQTVYDDPSSFESVETLYPLLYHYKTDDCSVPNFNNQIQTSSEEFISYKNLRLVDRRR